MRRFMVFTVVCALSVPIVARADEPQEPPPPRCEMGSCYDPLFTLQYPPTHSYVTSSGVRIGLPAHAYDGSFALIVGRGDLESMQAWTADTGFQPIRTDRGAGVAVFIVAERTDTTVGPFDEIVVAFPVSTDIVTVADDAGAMLGAVVDPRHLLWLQSVVTDSQLVVDFGREYVSMPIVTDPKVTTVVIQPAGSVEFHLAEQDGTPIAHGDLRFDRTRVEPTIEFASHDGARAFASDVATRPGSWRVRLVSRHADLADATTNLTVIGHAADPASVLMAECCSGSPVWANPDTPFGAALTAIRLEPVAIASFEHYRFVFDVDL